MVILRAYHQSSNIRLLWVGNEIVDHSDVVGASPVGAAPTTSSFSTLYLASMDWPKSTARRDDNHLSFQICGAYLRDFTVIFKLIVENSSLGIHCKIVLRWMPQNLNNEKSTLVQVMAWCHPANALDILQPCTNWPSIWGSNEIISRC